MLRSLMRKLKHRRRFPGLGFDPSVRFEGGGRLAYGERCSFERNCILVLSGSMRLGSHVTVLEGSEFDCQDIILGNHVSVQRNSSLLGHVEIGSYCVLGPNLYVASGGHQFRLNPPLNIRDQDALMRKGPRSPKKVSIGEDCWFGTNVVVREGVTIGKGCVIGANSVVTKDVPPYGVAAGAPAKVIAKRLDFAPPREIVPGDAHVPYFYQGFRTLASERREGAILLSAAEFTVAIDTRGAAGVRIDLTGAAAVRSGSEAFPVSGGCAEIPAAGLRIGNGLAAFSLSEGEWRGATISRISAY